MKQTSFADLLGVTQATVSRWESGAQSPTDAERKRILSFFPELRRDPRQGLIELVQQSLQVMALFNEQLEPLAISQSCLSLHGYKHEAPSLTKASLTRPALANLLHHVSNAGGFFGGNITSVIHPVTSQDTQTRTLKPYTHRSRFFPWLYTGESPVLLMESAALEAAELGATGETIDFSFHDGTHRRVFPLGDTKAASAP